MRHAVCRGTISAMQTFARLHAYRLLRRDAHRLARRAGIRANATVSPRCSGTGVRVPARPERRRARRAAHRAADTDQPRLRVVHSGRRQPQRERRRLVPQAGRDRVDDRRCRCCDCTASGSTASRASTSSRRTCLPAACSISSRTPRTKHGSCMSDPDGVRRSGGAPSRACARAPSRRATRAAACFTSIRTASRARRPSRRSKG